MDYFYAVYLWYTIFLTNSEFSLSTYAAEGGEQKAVPAAISTTLMKIKSKCPSENIRFFPHPFGNSHVKSHGDYGFPWGAKGL